MLARLRSWLRALSPRGSTQREIDQEIAFHLESEIAELERAGYSPVEARRRAHASFGAVAAIREESRQAHGTYALETLLQDTRFAARLLVGNPGFTLTAVLTLAMTIGAVSTVATMAYALYWRPLPVPRPAEVVEVVATRHEGTRFGFVSYPDYLRFRDGLTSVGDLAAVYSTSPLFITNDSGAEEINGAVVSANLFSMLEIEPELGRFFTAEEDAVPGRNPVVVLGHDYWQAAFGSDESVLGRSLSANGTSFTIIGVAPAGFHGLVVQPAQVFLPTMMMEVGYRWCSVLDDADCTILTMYGRLRDGATIETAGAEAGTLVPDRWRNAEPGDNSGATVVATQGTSPGPVEQRFLSLLGAVAGVLLVVCCANLAGLLLSRSAARARELAIRTSLGASRSRLVRQLLTESSLVALAGGAAGLLVSAGLTALLQARFYSADAVGRPLNFDFALSPAVVATAALVSGLAGVLFGVLPALRLAGHDGLRRTASGGARSGAVGRWLIGGQVAGALALVVVATLLGTSAAELIRGTNFDPEHVVLMRLRPRAVAYEPAAAQEYLRAVRDSLLATPGVESLSMVGTGVPLFGLTNQITPHGSDLPVEVGYLEISEGYFETLRIEIVRGRAFEVGDDLSGPPVAIVNSRLAESLWPDGDAVGASLGINGREHTIIGIAADVRVQSRGEGFRPYVYVPFWQNPEQVDARLQIRVAGDADTMLPVVAKTAFRTDPVVPVAGLVAMRDWIAGNFRTLRLGATAVAYAGLLAVILSAIGLFAALAAAVTQRNQEIGLRLAVGATGQRILALILRDGLVIVAFGILGGLALAAAAIGLLQHILYGTSSGDPAVFVAGAALVVTVGLLASLAPALRAARTDPMVSLRSD